MKKKNLNKLSLGKRTVSNLNKQSILNAQNINGGSFSTCITILPSVFIDCATITQSTDPMCGAPPKLSLDTSN